MVKHITTRQGERKAKTENTPRPYPDKNLRHRGIARRPQTHRNPRHGMSHNRREGGGNRNHLRRGVATAWAAAQQRLLPDQAPSSPADACRPRTQRKRTSAESTSDHHGFRCIAQLRIQSGRFCPSPLPPDICSSPLWAAIVPVPLNALCLPGTLCVHVGRRHAPAEVASRYPSRM